MSFDPEKSTSPAPQAVPPVSEKYLIAFVIQGDDVFKITADNIIHTIGTADGPAFDAIAKLKAAAALLELTNRHKERPEELKKMAKELAGEGMKLMARASSSIRSTPAFEPEDAEAESPEVQTTLAKVAADLNTVGIPPASGPRAVPLTAAPASLENNANAAFFAERPRTFAAAPVPVPAPVPAAEDRATSAALTPGSRIALISS